MNIEKFSEQFRFNEFGTVGLEEEIWLVDENNKLKPAALDIIKQIAKNALLGNGNWPEVIEDDNKILGKIKRTFNIQPELPAQQMEITTGICKDAWEVIKRLEERRKWLDKYAEKNALQLSYDPAPDVGPDDLLVFPQERYLAIKEEYGKKVLNGYIAALHVHIGLSNLDEAARALNYVAPRIRQEFNFAYSGKRLKKYFSLAGTENFLPPAIRSWEHYYLAMKEIGCLKDPTRCWWLIRLSPHGTIELRIADTTEDTEKIKQIIEKFVSLIKQALK